MAKSELGTKRIDPETGRKFYDLNKDPIVSPYTGKTYARSYFDDGKASIPDDEEEVDQKETDAEEEGADVVSLEEADDEVASEDDDDDTFLEEDEEDDDDVSDLIDGDIDNDEDT